MIENRWSARKVFLVAEFPAEYELEPQQPERIFFVPPTRCPNDLTDNSKQQYAIFRLL
jgi:hypothetical protein